MRIAAGGDDATADETVVADSVDIDGLLAGLNDQQRAAVEFGDGPLVVFAGAGSGKTRVLTSRIAHLIAVRHVHPAEILAITFTNKAAGEMRSRVTAAVGANGMLIATFHSACLRLMRPFTAEIGLQAGFSIMDEGDALRLCRDAVEDGGYDPKVFRPGQCLDVISQAKNALVGPDEFAGQADNPWTYACAEVYRRYQQLLVDTNAVDFDDILVLMVRLLNDHEPARRALAGRFRHVLVDEFQDTNVAQHEIIRLLSETHRNVCVVGDLDQSIYRFRGADIANIHNFLYGFPEATTITLEHNYRSSQPILDAANAVIDHNTNRPPKRLFTDLEGGAQLTCQHLASETDEGRWIAGEIRWLADQGQHYGDIAVLCRTRAVRDPVEYALHAAEIPCQVVGGTAFFDRRIVRDILAYLRVALNPADTVALRRAVNEPRRGVGAASVKKLLGYAARCSRPAGTVLHDARQIGLTGKAAAGLSRFAELVDEIRTGDSAGVAPDEIISRLVDHAGWYDDLLTLGDDDSQSGVEAITHLVSLAEPHRNIAELLEYSGLVTEGDDIDNDGRVMLMTIHAAKGLEWPVVFVPGLEDGVFPDYRALDDQAGVEEERRLAYVAITRAQRLLYLSHVHSRSLYGQIIVNRPSRFLDEIPTHLLADTTPHDIQAEAG